MKRKVWVFSLGLEVRKVWMGIPGAAASAARILCALRVCVMRATLRSVLAGLAAFMPLVSGCDDPLLRAQDLTELRVLGARVEVLSETSRAEPRRGEAARVRFLLASPTPDERFGYYFEACWQSRAAFGVPTCETGAFQSWLGVSSIGKGMELELRTPPEAPVTERVLILGAVCPSSEVVWRGVHGSFCEASAERIRLTSTSIAIASETANNNPAFRQPGVLLDGEEWPLAPPSAPCASLRQVLANGAEHLIELRVDETTSEQLEPLDPRLDSYEAFTISQVATHGALRSPYAWIFPSEENFAAHLVWVAPEGISGSEAASFYFVLRDRRGGVSWERRELCVVPR